MRAKKNGHAAKRKAPAREREAKPKKTVEQLSDEQRQALLFQHKRKLKPLLADEALAKAAVTKAFELAKKEGIPKKELKFAIALETEEGQQAARQEYAAQRRVARWMNVKLGTQKDMFGEQYFEDGKIAALDDKPRRPPANLAIKDSDRWMAGYDEGRVVLNTRRASGFKSLGEVAADLPFGGGTEAADSLAAH